MEGTRQVCRNCNRSVATAHLTLHEAHCLPFLAPCPECKEPACQEKMDEHRKNGHQEVRCAMCQQTMQKHLLEFHEGNKFISPTGLQSLQASDCDRTACLQPTSECQEHPYECTFCEAAVSLSKLEIHEHHCSNRTELCQNCGQLIVLHALAQHRDVCQSEQAQLQRGKRISVPENSICCHYCNLMIPENKFLHHMEKCWWLASSKGKQMRDSS
ncbi:XIAP-associated factor 1-like [Rhynchonycteris naso]